MISLNNIKPNKGSRKSSKKLGRWNASWKWTTCGRGYNGQNSRSGWGVPDWFEWGQTPLFRRLPKLKGFSNSRFKKHFSIVNLSDVEKLAQNWVLDINKEVLLNNWIVSNKKLQIKLLWKWSLSQKINITVDKASASAKKSIESLWGNLELINSEDLEAWK